MLKYYYFFILFLGVSLNVVAQNSYEYIVNELPYQVFQEQDLVQFNQDDIYSGVVTIPFAFNFFELGDTTEFVVGSNGAITFNSALAGTNQAWFFDPIDLIPSAELPFPSILGAYHDLFNIVDGGVYTGITGVAPHRRLHITYENIAHFSCQNLVSTSQIILHETTGIIDVVITEKPVCVTWNDGLAVVGLQAYVNNVLHGISAPGRNTGQWTAQEEAWRFIPASFLGGFDVVLCDVNTDGIELFDINLYKDQLIQLFNLDPTTTTVDISFEGTPMSGDTINVLFGDDLPENMYEINMNNGEQFFPLSFALVNCDDDGDTDSLTNGEEDVNGNGNLNDDDTDGDGIPNYLDDDDDGDTVMTNIELVFGGRQANGAASATFLDTDSDGIPNHLDFDDDGDGVLTLNEDYNGNGDPTDDDMNMNGIPDYLDNQQLSVEDIGTDTILFTVYPNPASSQLFVKFANEGFWGDSVTTRIYDYQGRMISETKQTILNSQVEMNISALASGNYLLILEKNNLIKAKKFVVE